MTVCFHPPWRPAWARTLYRPTSTFLSHNQAAGDRQAAQQCEWSRPVSSEQVSAARNGQWQVHLTPRALPPDWLGEVRDRRILCLASAGGQQAPILAAAGARVTVFDLSAEQLGRDRMCRARRARA